jgi:plastocyanin/Mg-chelatase subunit ChlD
MIRFLRSFMAAIIFSLVSGNLLGLGSLGQPVSAKIAAQDQPPIAITMNDIFYDLSAFAIPANTDVTVQLKNNGFTTHNFSIDALGISVDVPPGDTGEAVINAPTGTFEYFCNQPGHKAAGMVGTLTVEEGEVALPVAATTAPDEIADATNAPEATISALQTEVALLQTPDPSVTPTAPSPTPAADADTPESQERDRSAQTVNVELILDVSGSMGQVLDTGETRMDAAKRVLDSVIAAIPDQEGINVGLRIYGFAGDNTEAGQTVSCQSSDLIVPVAGVDKEELEQQIGVLQPTGWTPIGLSLERAAEDFPSADEDAVNAVVLVTDGLETCGADPASVAGAIRQGEQEIVTHVIGFALTEEEQRLLSGIADQGEGLLLGAGTADELSQALFSVLEELEIVTGVGYIAGNAFPLIPAGEPGEVSVVAMGTLSPYGGIPFVIRNNTDQNLRDVTASVTARDPAGNLLGVANVLTIRPSYIRAGGLGIGLVPFGGISLPPDAVFDIELQPKRADQVAIVFFHDLDIVEASLFEDRIVGVVENKTDQTLTGPTVTSMCFDLNGTPLTQDLGGSQTTIAPGDTQEFQVTNSGLILYGQPCPAFLVTATGI